MRILSILALALIFIAAESGSILQDCYLQGKTPCGGAGSDERLSVYGGTLKGNNLCCTPNLEKTAGILRACSSCGGDYPYDYIAIAAPNCQLGETKIFGPSCSGEATPTTNKLIHVCSSNALKTCTFGGATFCGDRAQRGYLSGWVHPGVQMDYNATKNMNPGLLNLCCNSWFTTDP